MSWRIGFFAATVRKELQEDLETEVITLGNAIDNLKHRMKFPKDENLLLFIKEQDAAANLIHSGPIETLQSQDRK